MPLDERPEPIRARVVGYSFGEQDCSPGGQSANQLPRTHDPAQVGHPVQVVVFLHIHLVGDFLGNLDEKPSMDVNRPLGPAGGPRGVCNHQGAFRVERLGRTVAGFHRDEVIPIEVTGGGWWVV